MGCYKKQNSLNKFPFYFFGFHIVYAYCVYENQFSYLDNFVGFPKKSQNFSKNVVFLSVRDKVASLKENVFEQVVFFSSLLICQNKHILEVFHHFCGKVGSFFTCIVSYCLFFEM